MIQSPHCSKSQKSLTKIKTTKKSLETIDFGFFSKKNDVFSFCCCSNNKKDTKKSEKDENFIVVFVRKGPKRGRQRVGGWQHKKGKQLPHIFQFCYQRFISGYNGHSTHKKIKIRTKYFVLKKGKRTKSLRKLMLNGKGIPPKKTRQIVIKSSFLAFRVELYFIWPTKGR